MFGASQVASFTASPRNLFVAVDVPNAIDAHLGLGSVRLETAASWGTGGWN